MVTVSLILCKKLNLAYLFILPENGLKTPPLNYNNLSKLATLLDTRCISYLASLNPPFTSKLK